MSRLTTGRLAEVVEWTGGDDLAAEGVGTELVSRSQFDLRLIALAAVEEMLNTGKTDGIVIFHALSDRQRQYTPYKTPRWGDYLLAISWLEEKGLLERIEDINHLVLAPRTSIRRFFDVEDLEDVVHICRLRSIDDRAGELWLMY